MTVIDFNAIIEYINRCFKPVNVGSFEDSCLWNGNRYSFYEWLIGDTRVEIIQIVIKGEILRREMNYKIILYTISKNSQLFSSIF